jgi:hypothetical protein
LYGARIILSVLSIAQYSDRVWVPMKLVRLIKMCLNETKLMEMLKKTDIDRRERRLISKLHMDQSVKVQLDQGVIKSVKIGRGIRQGCCLSPLLFNLYSEYVTQKALEGCGDFIVGGQIICMVRYADYLVLLAKAETILKTMIDKLIEVGRGYGMEITSLRS